MRTLLALLLALVSAGQQCFGEGVKPNVVLIMADDLGFSDLGCYGGEIATPQLDALAADGLRFTQFYNTGRCWPTRASLLSGFYAQQIGRDKLEGIDNAGNRRDRPSWAPLVAKPLAAAGYRNYHVGKWHVDGLPRPNGFHRSYYLKDQHRFFSPTKHQLDDQELDAVPPGTDYYATTELANRSIEFLDQHAAEHTDAPFFLYLAFAAPHFPLHALPEDIARYEGKYVAGWDKLRSDRWQRVQELALVEGNTSLSDIEPETGPPYDLPKSMKILGPNEVNRPLPWSDLTDEQREFQANKMEIHAAMIDRMDREIGRALDRVKAMGTF